MKLKKSVKENLYYIAGYITGTPCFIGLMYISLCFNYRYEFDAAGMQFYYLMLLVTVVLAVPTVFFFAKSKKF